MTPWLFIGRAIAEAGYCNRAISVSQLLDVSDDCGQALVCNQTLIKIIQKVLIKHLTLFVCCDSI